MNDEHEKVLQILKYGNYLPRKLDIDLSTIDQQYRRVCSINDPDGIYGSLPEMVETELNIRFEDWCEMTGRDINKYIDKE